MSSAKETIRFIDNPSIHGSDAAYIELVVDTPQVLESWKNSLFSFEWLLPDGRIRSLEQLPEVEQVKRSSVEDRIRAGQPIEKPVLGIGIMDNIEIGMGRAEFLTLAARGIRAIPVHIRKASENDFKAFAADVKSGA